VWDILAIACVFAGLIALVRVSPATFQPLDAPDATVVTLDPANLPVYALRTTMRMFAALLASLVFTFTVAPLAAKSRRAGLVLIPILDILQSVPILGFLTFTTAFFMSLFPGKVAGLELAAIFAVFTSQAWNMAFSMYQSLTTLPNDLVEATRAYRLSGWQRFWKLEVPFAMPGLVWNMMLSMSGGWFFVVASEAITLGDQSWKLPGIGSYVATALDARSMSAIWWAILAMFVVILLYDQLLFRPLVAWSAKFRVELTASTTGEDPWVLKLMRRTRVLQLVGGWLSDVFGAIGAMRLQPAARAVKVRPAPSRFGDAVFIAVAVAVAAAAAYAIFEYVTSHDVGWADLLETFELGLITMVRVFVMIALATALWVPIGGGAVRRCRPGQPVLPDLRHPDREVPWQLRYLADPADDPGHPVVHSVQRHRRCLGLPRRLAGSGEELPRRRLSVVAARHPARHLPLFRDGRHHRVRRLLERRHRGRGRQLG
jgi:NitT/TauT family transport system permease protein